MPIRIPTDITIVTLSARGRQQRQRFTERSASALLGQASELLKDRAGIEFPMASCSTVVETMPTGSNPAAVDESGYHYLVAAYPAGRGVRTFMVDQLARRDLGGQSRRQKRACIVGYTSNVAQTARMLAHELCHLLELEHADTARTEGPGQEREAAAWLRNLMYSGALNPAAELTPAQVQQARRSALARRFGGP